MGSKCIKSLIIVAAFYLGSIANAGIFIDGNLHSGNTLNLGNSSYNNSFIKLTADSVLNIYYEDEYVDYGDFGFYQPAFQFNFRAEDNSIVNFIYPDNYDFVIAYGDLNTMATYTGLEINNTNYSMIANGSELMRDYEPSTPQVLTPYIGIFQLQDDAVINFVPEPSTVLLLSIGGILIRKKSNK